MLSNRQFVIIGVGMALICLIPVALVHVAWLVETWPTKGDLLCKGDDCSLLGWLSGLSGWAAIGAAWVTLKALRQQINEANRHQRENLELSIAGRIRLARNTQLCSLWGRMSLSSFLRKVDDLQEDNAILIGMLLEAEESMEMGTLLEFTREIGTTYVRAAEIARRRIRESLQVLKDGEAKTNEQAAAAMDVRLFAAASYARQASYLLETITNDAGDFLTKWKSRVD